MNESLSSYLSGSDPANTEDDTRTRELLSQMSDAARTDVDAASDVRPPRRWRRRTLIPLGIAGLVALTGAGILVPVTMTVNGIPVEFDAEIPIMYTTESGVDVSCQYGLYFGDPAERTAADEDLAAFVRAHNWTGIGQRIYEDAMAHPFVPGPDDDWETSNQTLRDSFSFERSTQLIYAEIPSDLLDTMVTSGATSNCTGQLR